MNQKEFEQRIAIVEDNAKSEFDFMRRVAIRGAVAKAKNENLSEAERLEALRWAEACLE